MGMNDYDYEEQAKLIRLAEFIINNFDDRTGEELIENGWDSENFVKYYDKIRNKALELFPYIADDNDEEENGD